MSEEKARTSAEVVEELKTNFEKFTTDANLLIEKGNNSAGVRSRVTSSAIGKLLLEYRKVSVAK